jgi:gliding motility-associated-like protein
MAYYSSQNTGCAPLTVSFLEDVKDAIFHTWNFGDGTVSNEPNPVHVYTSPGTYVVTLTAVNFGGCQGVLDTLVITVTDPGTAEFTSDPTFPADLSLPGTQVQFTDLSFNAISWIWDFGDGGSSTLENPAHTYTQIGDFTVTLTIRNPDGCISQVSHGPYIVKSPDLFIPNVFSPNEDNNNDVWLVRYTGDQPFQADIVDRWGNLLWSTRNKTEGWKGLGPNGQAVPDGVYFYRVIVGDQEYAGDVTVVR